MSDVWMVFSCNAVKKFTKFLIPFSIHLRIFFKFHIFGNVEGLNRIDSWPLFSSIVLLDGTLVMPRIYHDEHHGLQPSWSRNCWQSMRRIFPCSIFVWILWEPSMCHRHSKRSLVSSTSGNEGIALWESFRTVRNIPRFPKYESCVVILCWMDFQTISLQISKLMHLCLDDAWLDAPVF